MEGFEAAILAAVFICAPTVYLHAVVVRHKTIAVCSKKLSVLIALIFMSGLWRAVSR
jgi:hypothetical protein